MGHEQFREIDPVIHAPIRLAIMSVLISVDEVDFTYLKEAVQTSDGNLSTHLTKLEQNELISINKSFKGKKPQTTCALTKKGREAFVRYINQMEQIIGMTKK